MADSIFGAGNAQMSIKYLIIPESKEAIKDSVAFENGTKSINKNGVYNGLKHIKSV